MFSLMERVEMLRERRRRRKIARRLEAHAGTMSGDKTLTAWRARYYSGGRIIDGSARMGFFGGKKGGK